MGTKLADQYHSIQIIDYNDPIYKTGTTNGELPKFNGVNTWDDFHLIPASRPVISPPPVKYNFYDYQGSNGSFDGSDMQNGYPLYGNREGSIDFYVMRDYEDYHGWADTYRKITNKIHGQKVRLILNDDPGWYYLGRIGVNNWASEKDWSKITLDYNVEPFKYSLTSSLDRWLWDPFNFVEGVVSDMDSWKNSDNMGGSIELTAPGQYSNIFNIHAGIMPISPVFSVYATRSGNGLYSETSIFNMQIRLSGTSSWTTREIPIQGAAEASNSDYGKWFNFHFYGLNIVNEDVEIRFYWPNRYPINSAVSRINIRVYYRYGEI